MIERYGVLLRYPCEGVQVSICYPGTLIPAALSGSFFHAGLLPMRSPIGTTSSVSPGLHSALPIAPLLARRVEPDEKRWAGLCGWLRVFIEGGRATWL